METLPNELIDRIAFFLSPADLKEFSLACHRIRSISLRHLFRRISLSYGLCDEAILEGEECYGCYVKRAGEVREIELLTESKSFYHHNVQGCHGSIIRDALLPFEKAETLVFFESSETSWFDFHSILRKQLETKPGLKYLTLQPNLGERGRGPDVPLSEFEGVNSLSVPRLRGLHISLFALDKKISGYELKRVEQFIKIVGMLGRVTGDLRTLILDGSLRIHAEEQREPLLKCRRLSFPKLKVLRVRNLRLARASLSDILTAETMRNVSALSGPRPMNWRTDTEILDRFLPFKNLAHLDLFHSHEYFRCSICGDSHRIFHIAITPAFDDAKILLAHLQHLKLIKWYSAYATPVLFRYKIVRDAGGNVTLEFEREKFEKVVGGECADYQGRYKDVEILPRGDGDDDRELGKRFPPARVNWQDLVLFEKEA
ncbi:hypothetical protein TWF481_000147 [Arthrobotrys musiformis]|uniref:F-box domain-containing protein n=1 Tax=Arthrobotrys musiformis TaxID=47236 RepID=A0AAV9WLX8_9PEZI